MTHPPLHNPNLYPRLQLRLYLGPDCWIGPGKADLLDKVDLIFVHIFNVDGHERA